LIDFWSEERGETHRETGYARLTLGLAHLQAANLDIAEKELREALHILRINAKETGSPVRFAETQAALAECLTIRGRHAEAEPLLIYAYELVREYGKGRPAARERTLERLVTLYETWGNATEAARWRDVLFAGS
jgi:tetratricopeptide (TPR) repeat protein